jgi:serpin B
VDVNEYGTEAGAWTRVTMSIFGIGPPPEVVVVDRPFFYAIQDELTGAILFMGSLVDPT